MVTTREVSSQIANQNLLERRRRQIIKGASRLFSQNGYHKTTMREISKASKINLSQLYQYISSKDDILYLFYRSIIDPVADTYKSLSTAKDEDPVEQLTNFIHAVLKYIHGLSSEFLTMYTESRHLSPESLRDVLASEAKNVSHLRNLIIRGTKLGVFRTSDPFMSANLIQLQLMLQPLRGWNLKSTYSLKRFLQSFTDYVMNSLGVSEYQNRP